MTGSMTAVMGKVEEREVEHIGVLAVAEWHTDMNVTTPSAARWVEVNNAVGHGHHANIQVPAVHLGGADHESGSFRVGQHFALRL